MANHSLFPPVFIEFQGTYEGQGSTPLSPSLQSKRWLNSVLASTQHSLGRKQRKGAGENQLAEVLIAVFIWTDPKLFSIPDGLPSRYPHDRARRDTVGRPLSWVSAVAELVDPGEPGKWPPPRRRGQLLALSTAITYKPLTYRRNRCPRTDFGGD